MYPQGLLQMEKQLFEFNEGHMNKDEVDEVLAQETNSISHSTKMPKLLGTLISVLFKRGIRSELLVM